MGDCHGSFLTLQLLNSSTFIILQMKQVRQKHTIPHTISSKGYARLEEEMSKELNTEEEIDRVELRKVGHKQKEGKEPNPGVLKAFIERAVEERGDDVGSSVTNDLLAKALGDDKPWRLRGIGYGVTKTKMVVMTHYKNINKECRDNIKEEKTSSCVCRGGLHLHNAIPKMLVIQIYFFALCKFLMLLLYFSCSRIVPHHENDSPISRPGVEEVLGKDKAYRLLSWYNENEVVADTIITETYPKMMCHGMPICFGAYKVTVTASRVDDAFIYRQNSQLKCVQSAIGTYIKWAEDLILPAI
ncbi:hypothetical protein MKW98_003300 [Papaver atlanticum]|uniref:Uncharacterized protein n=1 Tax=Papaver atlanticum TaxID=357466 RepID=A0AAD4XUN9_9MAGN|nr:hypothetical protein MKW98_003300 [Papaver atlanticum]